MGYPPTGVWSGSYGHIIRTLDGRMVMRLPSRASIRMMMCSIPATGGIKDEGDQPDEPGDDNGEKILETFKVDTHGHPMQDEQGLRIPRSPDQEPNAKRRRMKNDDQVRAPNSNTHTNHTSRQVRLKMDDDAHIYYGFKFDPKALQPPLPEDFKIAASNVAGIKDSQFKRVQMKWLAEDHDTERGLPRCGVIGLSEVATKGHELTDADMQRFTDECCSTGRAAWTQHCGLLVTEVLDGYTIMVAKKTKSGRAIMLVLGRNGKAELVICVVYPHGRHPEQRKRNIKEVASLLRTAPLQLPVLLAGDWNFVQDPVKDTRNCKHDIKNTGLQQWKELASEHELVELLETHGGNQRSVTELTFSPFEIKKNAVQRYIPRKHKRLDWFCANQELCDRITGGTEDIRSSLETIPPWFKPPNNRARAGTDHATIVLQINTPNVVAGNINKKKETCANAKILKHKCKN
jgi:hypothetical protein